MLYPLSYSRFPNDVRGQAFRALLDTKCATPSCPSPNRGYQTIIPDGVSRFGSGSVAPWRLELSSSNGMVEPTLLLFSFHPWTFSVGHCRGLPLREPQHSPSVLVPAFRINARRVGHLRSLGLHSGLLAERLGWGPTLWRCYQRLSLSWAMPQGDSEESRESQTRLFWVCSRVF